MNALLDLSAPGERAVPAAEVLPAGQIDFKPNRQHLKRLRFYSGQLGRQVIPQSDLIDLDLEVAGLIAVQRGSMRASDRVLVTDAGRLAIFFDRRAIISSQSPHHRLASRLALALRKSDRLTWENIEFKAEFSETEFCYVRPDIFSILPTRDVDSCLPMVHEVKISRSDFLNDLATPRKREAYLHLAGSLTYVAPVGVIRIEDLPSGCGLLEETTPGVFVKSKTIRRSKKFRLTHRSLMNLVLKSYKADVDEDLQAADLS